MTLTSGARHYNGSAKDTFTNIQNVVLTDSGSGNNTLDASAFDGVSTGTALASLNNGGGVGASPSLSITLTNGSKVTVDLSNAETIQDVLNAIDAVAINNASDKDKIKPLTQTLNANGAISYHRFHPGKGTTECPHCCRLRLRRQISASPASEPPGPSRARP